MFGWECLYSKLHSGEVPESEPCSREGNKTLSGQATQSYACGVTEIGEFILLCKTLLYSYVT